MASAIRWRSILHPRGPSVWLVVCAATQLGTCERLHYYGFVCAAVTRRRNTWHAFDLFGSTLEKINSTELHQVTVTSN